MAMAASLLSHICSTALLYLISHALLPTAPNYDIVNPSDALRSLSQCNQSLELELELELIRTVYASRQIADCRHYLNVVVHVIHMQPQLLHESIC